MPLLTDYNNSQDTNFQYRIQEALVKTANDVQAEAANATNHQARSAYALLVLANPSGYAKLMAPGFTANSDNDVNAIATADLANDAKILTRASALWNNYCVQG